MARTHKEHDQRRREIIEAAWELFLQKGYEAATVRQIIEALNISKGAFYHYFGSKEELLDAAIGRLVEESTRLGLAAIEEEGLDAVERYNRFMNSFSVWMLDNLDYLHQVARVLYQPQNAVMRHKLYSRSLAASAPALAGILAQGQDEGVFDAPDPEEYARILLQLCHAYEETSMELMLNPGQPEKDLETLRRRLETYMQALERVLGAPARAFRLDYLELVTRLYERFRQGETGGVI